MQADANQHKLNGMQVCTSTYTNPHTDAYTYMHAPYPLSVLMLPQLYNGCKEVSFGQSSVLVYHIIILCIYSNHKHFKILLYVFLPLSDHCNIISKNSTCTFILDSCTLPINRPLPPNVSIYVYIKQPWRHHTLFPNTLRDRKPTWEFPLTRTHAWLSLYTNWSI